ncbi:MAG TPA: hypothetical protein IAC02_07050, partial [Candidatus Coprovivens excrementavium]|nr:hypothetical protein [Candidatus Coprovivens excrementavium]
DLKLTITNNTTNESQEFYNKTITNFAIIKNASQYLIVLIGYNEYQTDTITYYTYIDEKELDTETFIEDMINSFKELKESPTIEKIGYIVDDQTQNKYIFLETLKKDILILIEEKLYLLK